MGALSLMKCSKGGILLGDVVDMDLIDFSEWLDAAEDNEKRIAAASK